MKKVLILVALLVGGYAKADCCCDCKPKVKVVYKTKTVEKIIPVEKVVEKVVVVEKPIVVEKKLYFKIKPKKNRLSVLGGIGPVDLEVKGSSAKLTREPVFGLSYQRNLTETFNIGIQVQSNETVLGSVGLDF